MKIRPNLYVITGVLFISLTVWACGSEDTGCSFNVEFMPSQSHLGPEVNIIQNFKQSDCHIAALNIMVRSDEPVHTASFELVFDSSIVQFIKLEPGDFLETNSKDGVTYSAQVLEANQNILVVGISQSGNDPGRVGNGILTTIFFKAIKPGCTVIQFVIQDSSNNQLSQLLTVSNEEIPIAWQGGKLHAFLQGDTNECVPKGVNDLVG